MANKKNINLFLDTSIRQVKLQFNNIIELKNRASIFLGFSIVFMGFILSSETISNFISASLVNKIPLGLLVLSIILFTEPLFVQHFKFSPDPKKLHNNYKNNKEFEIKEKILKQVNADYSNNFEDIQKMRKKINLGIIFEFLAISWLVVVLFPLF